MRFNDTYRSNIILGDHNHTNTRNHSTMHRAYSSTLISNFTLSHEITTTTTKVVD
jgi:hypothetical protein